MPTSGSWDYSVTAGNIGTACAENLGVMAAGGTLASADLASMLVRLNYIVKQWQGNSDMAPGLKPHTRQRLTLFLEKGRQSYLVGTATTDSRATAQYGRTTIRNAEAAGQTVLDIGSTLDTTTYPGTTVAMTTGDQLGIELSDGTIQWTTISGTGAGPTVTAGVALTTNAQAGNAVYWFTNRAQRFPLLEYAVVRDENAIDVPMYICRDVQEYEALPDKTADATPQWVLAEALRLNTRLTFDTQPDDVSKVVNLTVLYPAEDYDAATNDVAFPQEWFAALEWELTRRCAPMFGVTWTQEMQMNYQDALAMARQTNAQNTSLSFEPGRE